MNVSVPRYDRAYSHAEKLVFYEKSKVFLFLWLYSWYQSKKCTTFQQSNPTSEMFQADLQCENLWPTCAFFVWAHKELEVNKWTINKLADSEKGFPVESKYEKNQNLWAEFLGKLDKVSKT